MIEKGIDAQWLLWWAVRQLWNVGCSEVIRGSYYYWVMQQDQWTGCPLKQQCSPVKQLFFLINLLCLSYIHIIYLKFFDIFTTRLQSYIFGLVLVRCKCYFHCYAMLVNKSFVKVGSYFIELMCWKWIHKYLFFCVSFQKFSKIVFHFCKVWDCCYLWENCHQCMLINNL